MTEPFEEKLERLAAEALPKRVLRQLSGAQGPVMSLDGKEVLLFCSNNYLGLSNHPDIKQAAINSVRRYGWGSGASRLISGHMEAHQEFEDILADFLDKPAALLFGSGYALNTGLLTSLLGKGDKVFADRLCHASILDGAIASGAKLIRFSHNDPDSLKRLIEKEEGRGKRLIVTEGLFSMDGDRAPLAAIAGIAERYGAFFMVDDAHGFGVFGPEGRGSCHLAGAHERVDMHVVTLGKALGGAGGAVTGSRKLIEGLVNFSRQFIFSTAPPPAVASAGIAAIKLVSGREGEKRRKILLDSAKKVSGRLKKMGWNTGNSDSQIIPVIIGDENQAIKTAGDLLKNGIYIPAIRFPTAPKGAARLRLTVSSEHTSENLERLFQIFGKIPS